MQQLITGTARPSILTQLMEKKQIWDSLGLATSTVVTEQNVVLADHALSLLRETPKWGIVEIKNGDRAREVPEQP